MARIAIEMPKLGYDMETGKVGGWLKRVGDTITRGDVIAEIETDKSTVEMEATASGTLAEIVHDAGARSRSASRSPGSRTAPNVADPPRRRTPRTRSLGVTPSSPARCAARSRGGWSRARPTAPHFYLSTEIEMDALLAAGRRDQRGPRARGPHHGDGVPAPCRRPDPARAPGLQRGLGRRRRGALGRDQHRRRDRPRRRAHRAGPARLRRSRRRVDLAAGLADLVARTRAGKLRAAEIGEGTFTLSNLGMFDVTSFTAIITPPQVAILATARTVERPVVRDGEVVVRRIMTRDAVVRPSRGRRGRGGALPRHAQGAARGARRLGRTARAA